MKFDISEIKEIKEIYDSLEDEESKEIYLCRVLYSLTGDRKYIYDMVSPLVKKHKSEIIESSKIAGEQYHLYKNIDLYSFIKNQNKINKIVIFGAGNLGKEVNYWMKSVDIKPDAFCDNDSQKIGTIIDGLPVISVKSLKNDEDIVVVLATYDFNDDLYMDVKSKGISDDKIYRYEPNSLCSYYGEPYFDNDVVSTKENEIFVDGGAYCGETIEEFINWCLSFKKIYAFEPDDKNFNRLVKCISKLDDNKINIFKGGIWNKNEKVSFQRAGDDGTGSYITEFGETIETYSLDSLIGEEEVTYIKFDIEGSELKGLEGAKNIIIKNKPKLAICIYHKPEDVLLIPKYIKSLVPEYKFKIRHYTTYLYDTILYAQV